MFENDQIQFYSVLKKIKRKSTLFIKIENRFKNILNVNPLIMNSDNENVCQGFLSESMESFK